MKTMITAALALCLMGGVAAAQDHDHDHDRGGGHEEHRGGPPGGEHRGPGPGEAFRGPGAGPGRFRGPEPGFRPGAFLHDHGWRGGRYRMPGFRYPPGFGYRRWGFGSYLPAVFLAPGFYIGSYWLYGLPAPPPGYHWIRNGPDALLVRYGDGYILDAAYGIFY